MVMNEIRPIHLMLIFIAGWIVVSCIISLLGGWFRLARRYPLPNGPVKVIDSFNWRSLNLNYICGYSSCVNIKISDIGLILRTSLIFSILHGPILLPWSSISGLEYKEGFLKRIILHVGRNRLVFYGKVAKAIYKTIRSRKDIFSSLN